MLGGFGGSVWVMGSGHWIVGVMSFQKMYGLYGLKHHIVEISGDVTDAGRTDGRRQTREDRATQPMDAGWLSFAMCFDFLKPLKNPKTKKIQDGALLCPFLDNKFLAEQSSLAAYLYNSGVNKYN